MSNYAFVLVLLAAICHACWNFICKKTSGNLSVLWLGKIFALFVMIPLVLLGTDLPRLSAPKLPFLISTGILHTLYFYFLAKLYRRGEISTVYPIARGVGVAGTTVLGQVLLREQLSPAGVVAILLICAGILLIGFNQRGEGGRNSLTGAVLVGLIISGYSINDKVGVGAFHPLVFMTGQIMMVILFLLPVLLCFHRRELVEVWRTKKKYALFTGLGSLASYLLVLFAFRLGPATYIVAIRECSVVVGAFLGFLVLKEPFSFKKLLGISTVTAGMSLIYWATI